MSAHQTNKDNPKSVKCRHFCFAFDSHNYCATCRESRKGDDPCVTFESPCEISASFTEEQLIKITHRKRYVKKQKKDTTSYKDDELDLLGDEDVDSFTGSRADLESAADNLFTSPPRPRPQPLPFESLSLKTPAKTVPPTPGTALQQKIESKLEKSLGNTLNIHLQQQMGSFQASMLDAFQSLRDEVTSKKHLTLKEGPKVKSDHTRRFPAHDFLCVGLISKTSRIRQVMSTFKFGYPRLTLKEGSKVKSENIRRFTAHDFP